MRTKLLAGVINTTVALAMTYALGMAVVEVYAKAYKDYLENEELPNWMELFSSEMFLNYFVDILETYNKGIDSGK